MTDAQLFWDDQDPGNTGWWLRYRDTGGTEEGVSVDAPADANVAVLADALAGAIADGETEMTGSVNVFCGDQQSGTIELVEGRAVGWRWGWRS